MRTALLLIISCSYLWVNAQFRQNLDTYQYNLKLINPAFVGDENFQSFGVLYQTRLTKVDGSPESILLSYENQISKLNSGIGFIASSNSVGVHSYNDLNLQYAYHVNLKENSYLSFGLGFMHSINASNFGELNILDQDDPSFNSFTLNSKNYNFDLGVSFRSENLLIAIGSQNLFGTKNLGSFPERDFKVYNFYTHYDFDISANTKLTPTLFYRNSENRWFIDSGLRIQLFDVISLGYILRLDHDKNSNSVFISEIQFFELIKIYSLLYNQNVNSNRDRFGSNIEIGMNINIAN